MPKDPYKYFRVEAKELVEQLSRGVLDWEQGPSGKEVVGKLLRLAHTLKGAAQVVKQAEIARLAHALEDAFVPYADGKSLVRHDAESMLQLVDDIGAQLAALGAEQARAPEAASTPAAVDEAFESVRVDLADMDVLLEGLAETGVQLAAVKSKLDAIDEAVAQVAMLLHQLAPAPNNNGGRSLVNARSIAENLSSLLKPLRRNVLAGIEQAESELMLVHGTATHLRLVPASAAFGPLRRATRDTAQALGKQVEFEVVGGEHRVDAHVLSAIRHALMHVVRNAVAHGIELSEQRRAAGKSPVGSVTLRVERRGSRVAFICRDDGAGFDLNTLRRAAVMRELATPAQAQAFGTDEIIRLILHGGLSSSPGVTELSGRGIGLDVVRETVAKLKGEIAISTEAGKGATVEISLPVSLLSTTAVVVESGEIRALLPLDAVQETVRLRDDEIAHNPDGDHVVFHDKLIPLMPLWHALRQHARSARGNGSSSAIVVRSGAELAAVGVDHLLGTTTVLLRPVPPLAAVDPVIAGASLDAEGNAQLVLDPAALVLAAQRHVAISRAAPPCMPAVLVIDDSLTTRMLEQSILESAGYEVDVASSGEEAMDKARARSYSLFIVDIEMPGMDGFEFVARAKSDAVLGNTPSILVTSRASNEDRRRGLEAGARAYVVKSEFNQEQLLQTIRQLIG